MLLSPTAVKNNKIKWNMYRLQGIKGKSVKKVFYSTCITFIMTHDLSWEHIQSIVIYAVYTKSYGKISIMFVHAYTHTALSPSNPSEIFYI